ncbi:MAG: ribosome small subunit-dependent GTPase A [Actinomycetaceae bacterium]|nr:ribosome small subunit-dependent GTPase A [Actinomycetaceae bacterium]
MRRDIGTDDTRVRVRPGKSSRPRTKIRPDYSQCPRAMVTGVDRGRYRLLMEDGSGTAGTSGTEVTAVKARELGRGAIVVGDRVRVSGDVSGRKDTLARVVLIEERRTLLRRSIEDSDKEKALVANADVLAIVSAVAQPEPRHGMIDRCLVAAYDAGMTPLLVVTKSDLGSASELADFYAPLGLEIFVTNLGAQVSGDGDASDDSDSGVDALRQRLHGHESVLVGHSGVGKSTLINALIPDADRATGHVNEVTGKGRHTSTSAVSLALPPTASGEGGRIIDTPGVRSFGLAHISPDDVLRGFSDLEQIADEGCPRGCTHTASEPECALDTVTDERMGARLASYRRLLDSLLSLTEW